MWIQLTVLRQARDAPLDPCHSHVMRRAQGQGLKKHFGLSATFIAGQDKKNSNDVSQFLNNKKHMMYIHQIQSLKASHLKLIFSSNKIKQSTTLAYLLTSNDKAIRQINEFALIVIGVREVVVQPHFTLVMLSLVCYTLFQKPKPKLTY